MNVSKIHLQIPKSWSQIPKSGGKVSLRIIKSRINRLKMISSFYDDHAVLYDDRYRVRHIHIVYSQTHNFLFLNNDRQNAR